MTKQIRCYLAGWFEPYGEHKDWRDFVKKELEGRMLFYDPRFDTKQASIATFVYEDLRGVEGGDIVFYFMTHNSGDVGSSIESERGNCKNKLVVLCLGEDVKVPHPFLLGTARRMLIGLETGVAYLKKLAEYGIEDEFRAISELMEGE